MAVYFFIALYIASGINANANMESQSLYAPCHFGYYSCTGKGDKICSCDKLCKFYDDCCFDAKVLDESKSQSIIPSTGETVPFVGETTCEKTWHNSKRPSIHGVFMVSSCPASWRGDITVKTKCQDNIKEDFLDLIPVFDKSSNVTFKNQHCAFCHDVHNWIPWLLNISCQNYFYTEENRITSSLKETMMQKINSYNCNYRFEPSKFVNIRYCSFQFDYDLWNIDKDINVTSCKNRVFSPFSFKRNQRDLIMNYRNIQCLIKTFDKSYLANGTLVCFPISSKSISSAYPTISYLMDISSLLHTQQDKTRCSETEVYLSDQVGCQTLYCPTDKEPFGGTCVQVDYKTKGIMVDLLFEINGFIIKPYYKIRRIVLEVAKSKLGNISKIYSMSTFDRCEDTDTIFSGVQINTTEPCFLVTMRCIVQETEHHINKATFEVKKLIEEAFENYQQNISNGVNVKHVDHVNNSLCDCNESLRNPLYVSDQVLYETLLPCPAVRVHRIYDGFNESAIVPVNKTTYAYGNNYILNETIIKPEDVFLLYENYFLCVDTFQSKYQVDNSNANSLTYIRYVTNIVCTSISIISLIYSLFQYCFIPFLRQGKSELLFLLMLYLLFGQMAFFMLSHITIAEHVCEWIGMLHHFVWIGTFILMFLCSFRLYSEMKSLTMISISKRNSETGRYILFGMVLNVSVSLFTKMFNLLLSPTESWYGGQICFITKAIVLLVSFVIPVLLFQCGNIILFILMFHYIQTTAITSRTSAYNSLNFILIKISSMMGFSWLLSIIAIFVQLDFFLIIFENVSSLQGFFLALSFSCNARVYNFYYEKRMEYKRNKTQYNSTNSNSHSSKTPNLST